MHVTPLIATIVAALVVAFILGALAHRLKISPIAGYLMAGVVIAPTTPGIVADTKLAAELAEIGVILLMFGVGLHFSFKDLLAVRRIALPGAIVQISVATVLGAGLGLLLNWSLLASVIFGLSLSVASTVVLLRALQARNIVDTERGRIAVGWLIVEDLAMVLTLVLLPPIVAMHSAGTSDFASLARSTGLVFVKVAAFMAVMLVIGRRVIPSVLHWVAHTGSRELFRLAVLAIALGVAFGASMVFDVSFALGAFFAGMILGETQLSRRAAEETMPLRDAFAVLFFVSVGMLFDPKVIIEQPLALLATVLIILVGKSAAAYLIVRAFGYAAPTAFTISAALAQIGEFSFILAGLGVALGAMPEEARDLVLAGAIISIFLNPVMFVLISRWQKAEASEANAASGEDRIPKVPLPPLQIILVGYGRVGRSIVSRLNGDRAILTLVEVEGDNADEAGAAGIQTITANATASGVLEKAGIQNASVLLIAISDGVESGVIAARARRLNPTIKIVGRAHSAEEAEHLRGWGANLVVIAEEEAAARMAESCKLPEAPRHPTVQRTPQAVA